MSKISELNVFLSKQLERLDRDDITDDELKKEIARTVAITNIAKQVVDSAKASIDAEKLRQEYRSPSSMGGNIKLLPEV